MFEVFQAEDLIDADHVRPEQRHTACPTAKIKANNGRYKHSIVLLACDFDVLDNCQLYLPLLF
jgi:hypothetical protein